MIDYGLLFGGRHWRFDDSFLAGLYFDRTVYNRVTSLTDFGPGLDLIGGIGEPFFNWVLRQIPEEWIDTDKQQLEVLIERLIARKVKLPMLIRDVAESSPSPFPNWEAAIQPRNMMNRSGRKGSTAAILGCHPQMPPKQASEKGKIA